MKQSPLNYRPPRKPHPMKMRYMVCLTQLDDFMFKFDMGDFWRQSMIKAFLEKRGMYYVD